MFTVGFIAVFKWFSISGIKNKTLKLLKILRHLIILIQLRKLLCLAGADIIGLNCQFDPTTCIKTIKMMKEGLDREGLKPFLMLQPVGFHCQDAENCKGGYHELPEFPFGEHPLGVILEQGAYSIWH